MSDGKPNRDSAYDKLVGAYYGGRRAVRHPVTRRWLAQTAEELLAGYYGRSHRTTQRPHATTPVSVASSVDDGETLRTPGGGSEFEEYVVARFDATAQSLNDDSRSADSAADGAFEEYVVPRIPADGLSKDASLSESGAQGECQADVLYPLAGPPDRDGAVPPPTPSKGSDAPRPTPPTSAAASRNLAAVTAPDSSSASDDDFMADMQSILNGQSQYDPATKKTVAKNQLTPPPAPPSPASNSQEIFDKIAASMQYANTYDLGTVELENRFADFDRRWEADEKAKETRQARAAAKSMTSQPATAATTATTEDFIQDLEALRREALDKAGLGRTSSDYGRGALPGDGVDGESASFAMDARGTDLEGAFVTTALQTLFSNASDINAYFARHGAADFIDWFNASVAGAGPWVKKAIGTSAQTRVNFNAIWSRIPQIFGSQQINLLQFVSLMSVFVNEVGADLAPISERVGTKDHPGLAYPFDRIPSLHKSSYNTDGSNWTAYKCFRDPSFIAAHSGKTLGAQLQNTTEEAWAGHVYPGGYPTAVDPASTGFVMEADFYKFRGRGLIQTTWRGSYLNLIRFVQSYAGTQAAISARTTAWAGMTPDVAANTSSNADWDDLFKHTDLEIACVAIAQHNAEAGNYLNLSSDVDVLNKRDAQGSIWRVGKRVSGGDAYADLLRSRVIAICSLLGN